MNTANLQKLEQLNEKRRAYLAEVAGIRGDEDYSEKKKDGLVAEAYRRFKATETEVINGLRDEARQRAQRLEREAYAPPKLYGADPAFAEMSYRSALDSLEGIAKGEDPAGRLTRRLERAISTSDRSLQKAIAVYANEIGAQDVVKQYLATDEAESERWTKWYDAHHEHAAIEEAFKLGSAYQPVDTPPEVRRHNQRNDSSRNFGAVGYPPN